MTSIARPQLNRSITLNFQGDWGRANLHRVLGVLCYEMGRSSGPYTKIGIWNGRGGLDGLQAVGRGQVDVALSTPAAFARLAWEGRGPSAGEAFPHLRAIGYVPQNDRMVVAIRKELGIDSFADLRRLKPSLRVTRGQNDGINFMGLAAVEMFAASGIADADLLEWGCKIIEHEEPHECTSDMLHGHADMIIMEAIMTAYWKEMSDRVDLAFLSIEPKAATALEAQYGWTTATLPSGYHRGMTAETRFLDFSHFLLVTTSDLPEDVGYALAWSLVEGWEGIERQYRHIPPERSPVSYPLKPNEIWQTNIPLHAGAERYFREAGYKS